MTNSADIFIRGFWNPALSHLLPLVDYVHPDGLRLAEWCVDCLDKLEADYKANPSHLDYVRATAGVLQGIYQLWTGNKIIYETTIEPKVHKV